MGDGREFAIRLSHIAFGDDPGAWPGDCTAAERSARPRSDLEAGYRVSPLASSVCRSSPAKGRLPQLSRARSSGVALLISPGRRARMQHRMALPPHGRHSTELEAGSLLTLYRLLGGEAFGLRRHLRQRHDGPPATRGPHPRRVASSPPAGHASAGDRRFRPMPGAGRAPSLESSPMHSRPIRLARA